MGNKSKSKRKLTDNVLIQIPEQFNKIVSHGLPEIASEKCPSSISERLDQNPFLYDGAIINLERIGDRYKIMLQADEVGLLSRTKADIVRNCMSLGVNYFGRIHYKKGEYYAIFIRKTT